MSLFSSNKHFTSFQTGVTVSLALLTLFVVFFFINLQNETRLRTKYEKLIDETRLVQTMKSELLASAEAEKSSVMADTDEASKAFAQQSMKDAQQVEKARIEFEALVDKKSREAKCLDDFTDSWSKLREMDKQVLSLAVKNTNLKALRLSFGPAAAAIKHMEDALNKLMDFSEASHPNKTEIVILASKALTDALNIYALEAPHIAATTDAGMDSIERTMKHLDGQVQDYLSELNVITDGADKSLLNEALKSYQEFQNINKKIIDLSRQNSNIRSFEQSLGQIRNTMALCLDRLNELQEAVQENMTIKATK